jgi:hypothetical protein
MDVKGIYPKDVAVLVEFRATELEKIKTAMDDCKLTYFGPDQGQDGCTGVFSKQLFSVFNGIGKSLKDE